MLIRFGIYWLIDGASNLYSRDFYRKLIVASFACMLHQTYNPKLSIEYAYNNKLSWFNSRAHCSVRTLQYSLIHNICDSQILALFHEITQNLMYKILPIRKCIVIMCVFITQQVPLFPSYITSMKKIVAYMSH